MSNSFDPNASAIEALKLRFGRTAISLAFANLRASTLRRAEQILAEQVKAARISEQDAELGRKGIERNRACLPYAFGWPKPTPQELELLTFIERLENRHSVDEQALAAIVRRREELDLQLCAHKPA